jgi:glycosyltransferase involved in cell wall biosynthesis
LSAVFRRIQRYAAGLDLGCANFAATVHNGLPANLHEANYRPTGGYLAFIGRISPEKGPVDAIRIARSLGIPLKIAAKVDKVDESYFREVVQPMLSTGGVDFIGEISEREKGPFVREATALVFPICWPEPFGLVAPVIENDGNF